MKKIGIMFCLFIFMFVSNNNINAEQINSSSGGEIVNITSSEAKNNFIKFYMENGYSKEKSEILYNKALTGNLDSLNNIEYKTQKETKNSTGSSKIYTYPDGSIRKLVWNAGNCTNYGFTKVCLGGSLGVADGFHSANYKEDYNLVQNGYDSINKAYSNRFDAWNPLVIASNENYFGIVTSHETANTNASVRFNYQYTIGGEIDGVPILTQTVYCDLYNSVGKDKVEYGFYDS